LNGRILVGIQNGYELEELHNVAISSPAAKQVIKRNAGNTLWVNEAIVSADVSDATSAATANTLVLRDASGGANFAGTVNLATGVISDLRFEDYQAAADATFFYGTGAASAHRIALGGVGDSSTGTALFGAATVAAARTTMGLATTDTPTFGGLDLLTATTTTLNVYNSLSGANFERLSFRWASNVARIGTAKGGTGTARDLVLETDGTERIRVSTAGNVGIGTTTPSEKLEIVGGAKATSTSTTSPAFIATGPSSAVDTMQVRGTTTASFSSIGFMDSANVQRGSFGFGGSTASAYPSTVFFNANTGIAMSFGTNALERIRIAVSGNVGIGTTSPSALLDVNSDTVRLRTARTPASAAAAGNAGDICWDANYIYVCTATNTWKRIAISTWP
jgi:hypothetical protein